jgi:predicted DNA-binding antitoxin AbrB/MazE fold protein
MAVIEAIYQHGVFRPLSKVNLQENQRVQLETKPVETDEIRAWSAWLLGAQRTRQEFIERYGSLPDSAPDISADPYRDE